MEETSPSHSIEKTIAESVFDGYPPHITIDTKSMQVDSTNVIVDKSKYPFKDLGPAIIGNIVDNSSSTNEEKVEEDKKEEDVFAEKLVKTRKVSVEIEIPSMHIVTVVPSTPPIEIATIPTCSAQLDDDEVDT